MFIIIYCGQNKIWQVLFYWNISGVIWNNSKWKLTGKKKPKEEAKDGSDENNEEATTSPDGDVEAGS